MRACLPAAWRTPVASYITIIATTAAKAKSGDDQPIVCPTPAAKAVTRAEWALGIPPVVTKTRRSNLRCLITSKMSFNPCEIKQATSATSSTRL